MLYKQKEALLGLPYTEIATTMSKDKQAYICDFEYEFSSLPSP